MRAARHRHQPGRHRAAAPAPPTATVKAAPPVNTALPVVTGATLRGTTLSASPGTWSGPGLSYAYQWQHDSGSGYTDIAGATGTTYLLGVADVGSTLRIRVTATNADASVTATSIGSSVVQAGPPFSTARADDLRHRPAHLDADLDARRLGRDRERLRLPVAAPHERVAFADIAGRDRHDATRSTRPTWARRSGCASPPPTSTAPPARSARRRRSSSRRRRATPRSRPSRGAARLDDTLTAAPGDWTPGRRRLRLRRGSATASTSPARPARPTRCSRRTSARASASRSPRPTSTAARARPPPRRTRVAAPPVNTVAPAAPSGNAARDVHAHGRPRHLGHPGRVVQPTRGCAARPMRPRSARAARRSARASTYTLSAADVGRRLGVRVIATLERRDEHGRQRADRHGRPPRAASISRRPASPATPTSARPLNGDAGRWTFPSPDVDLRLAALRRGRQLQLHVGRRRQSRSTRWAPTTPTTRSCSSSPRRRPGRARPRRATPLSIRARPVPRSVVAPTVSGTAKRGRTLRAGTGHVDQRPHPLQLPVAALRRRELPGRSPAPPPTPTCSPRPTRASP